LPGHGWSSCWFCSPAVSSVAATIGNFTPPVGAAMYAVCSILRCPVGSYTRESLPFLAATVAVTLLLIFVPEFVLFVPDLFFGKE
jgi:TRAP-type C4-dicarboxylate transport system permease large subunit